MIKGILVCLNMKDQALAFKAASSSAVGAGAGVTPPVVGLHKLQRESTSYFQCKGNNQLCLIHLKC
jgi:hypothetical protein